MRPGTSNAVISILGFLVILVLAQLSSAHVMNQLTALYGIAVLGLVAVVCLVVSLWHLRNAGLEGLRQWLILVPLCIGALLGSWNTIMLYRALTVPPIHDISTDIENPPAFMALADIRERSANGLVWGGAEHAAQQQLAYPDIVPVYSALPPVQAFVVMRNIAVSRGWRIAEARAEAGRVEASVQTRFMGFVDDVVIRVLPDGKGSRIDIRSMSRIGQSDLGANAARIRLLHRDFLQQAEDFLR